MAAITNPQTNPTSFESLLATALTSAMSYSTGFCPSERGLTAARASTFGPRGLSLFVRRLEPSARLCRTAEKRWDRRGHRRRSRALPAGATVARGSTGCSCSFTLLGKRSQPRADSSRRQPAGSRTRLSWLCRVVARHYSVDTQQDGSSLNKCLTTKLLPRRRTIRSSELDVDEWPPDSPGRAELLERFCERISDAFDDGQRRFQAAPNTPGAGTIEPSYA